MAKTRMPKVHNLHFVVGTRSTYGIQCPGCKKTIALGEYPVWSEGYRVDEEGFIAELVVCRNITDGEICDWHGPVRLIKQVQEL